MVLVSLAEEINSDELDFATAASNQHSDDYALLIHLVYLSYPSLY